MPFLQYKNPVSIQFYLLLLLVLLCVRSSYIYIACESLQDVSALIALTHDIIVQLQLSYSSSSSVMILLDISSVIKAA